MAESSPADGRGQPADKAQEAYKAANSITLHHLKSKLEQDPGADVSDLLQQLAASYPNLRASLAKDAVAPPGGPSASSSDEATGRNDLLLDTDCKVALPLHDRLTTVIAAQHPPGLDSAAISNLNRLLRQGRVLWSLHGTSVLDMGHSLAVKITTDPDLDEAHNLRCINSHASSVPAPTILGCISCRGWVYLFMSLVDGVPLDSIWGTLSAAHKRSVRNQLNAILRDLRSETLDKGSGHVSIGGFVSGVCRDMRRSERVAPGRITSEGELNHFLCFSSGRTQTPWITMVRSYMKQNHRLVRTHGDLHPRNIMVRWDPEMGHVPQEERCLRVVSLIDWERSGWYPEYWEFVKALNTDDKRGPLADWCDYLPTEAIGQWPYEFSIDLLLSRWLG